MEIPPGSSSLVVPGPTTHKLCWTGPLFRNLCTFLYSVSMLSWSCARWKGILENKDIITPQKNVKNHFVFFSQFIQTGRKLTYKNFKTLHPPKKTKLFKNFFSQILLNQKINSIRSKVLYFKISGTGCKYKLSPSPRFCFSKISSTGWTCILPNSTWYFQKT